MEQMQIMYGYEFLGSELLTIVKLNGESLREAMKMNHAYEYKAQPVARAPGSFAAMMTALLALAVAMLLLLGCQPIQPEAATGSEAPAAAESTEAESTEAEGTEAEGGEAEGGEMAAMAPAASDALVGVLPEITIAVTADGVVVPDGLMAGPTIVNLVNDAGTMAEDGSPILADMGRLAEGATPEQVMEAAAMANEDPSQALALIKLYGQKIVPMGRMIYDLQPGLHMAITTNGELMGTPFEVMENPDAAAVEADVMVELVDFAFAMPDVIAAGPQLWQIDNAGSQWHEIVVLQTTEEMTTEELMAVIFSEEEMQGPPPFEVPFGYVVISEGNRAFVDVDLAPGEYTVICFLPDLLSDFSPHAMHGMVRTLTVE